MATTPRTSTRPPPATDDEPAPLPPLEIPPVPDVLSRLGFNVLTASGVALGALAFLVARLLDTIYINDQMGQSNGSGNHGLLQASLWTAFGGLVILTASLLVAALWGRRAHWGARVVLLALTVSLLLSSSGSSAAAVFASLANMFGRF